MRGGIAERGGIRVGHRIIEINGQSVVATTHDKIIQILTNAVGEVRSSWYSATWRLECALQLLHILIQLKFILEWDVFFPLVYNY